MRRNSFRALRRTLAGGALLLGACTVSDASNKSTVDTAGAAGASAPSTVNAQPAMPATADTSRSAASAATSPPATPATPAASTMRVEVDLNARKLSLYENDRVVETHSVAVGSQKWPTQTGEWTIRQVVFNPEWIPPDETWAEEREPRKPGDPKNPLGHAQLVYDPPRTIHGTNDPASIGRNVSHGSIRMRNAEIVALAKRIMAGSGAQKDSSWFAHAAQQRTEKQVVDLPTPVPIKVF